MYQFSRSIYRDLVPRIDASGGSERTFAARRKVLEACEATIERLVSDRRYFARPAKTWETRLRPTLAAAAIWSCVMPHRLACCLRRPRVA